MEQLTGEPLPGREPPPDTAPADDGPVLNGAGDPLPEETATAPKEAAEKPAPEPAADVPTEKLESALVVAKRENIPTEVFERWMRENPDEVLAWAEARGKHLEKTDEDYRELERLRSRPLVQPSPTPSPGGDNQPGSDDKPSGSVSSEETATTEVDKAAVAKAQELFGLSETEAREAVALLRPSVAPAPDPRIDALQAQLTATQQSAEQVAEVARQQQIEAARGQLQSEFPGLADKERFDRVRQRAAKLIASEVYGTHQVQEAFSDAARLEFWNDREQVLGAKGKPVSQTEQPSDHQSNTAPLPKTRERGDLAMHYLMQGKSAEEAQALVDKAMRGRS